MSGYILTKIKNEIREIGEEIDYFSAKIDKDVAEKGRVDPKEAIIIRERMPALRKKINEIQNMFKRHAKIAGVKSPSKN